ncbi:hypothetical protein CLV41_103276 [Roseibium marinum]|uniref:Uncharacterized protein n=2 Tax=Roseibium marinum TaxID=281252 RepID=A0A2S3UXV1_9HYPH|nr:hypothetical protein CLV41_103276 [Roseibium marinum]
MTFHRELRELVDWTWQHWEEILRVAVAHTGRPKGQTHMELAPAQGGNGMLQYNNPGIDKI